MFEYQGNTYTMQDLQQAAAKRGMDFNSYLNVMKNAGLKEIGDTEQSAEITQPSQQTSNRKIHGKSTRLDGRPDDEPRKYGVKFGNWFFGFFRLV